MATLLVDFSRTISPRLQARVLDFRDSGVQNDPVLIDEAYALARIFAKAVKTARNNTSRMKHPRNSY